QLIVNKRITTTLAKAKALRIYVEPLITKTRKGESKEQIMHQHRVVFSYLKDKHAVKELFTVVAPKVASRPGGYTRIIKLGTRLGDNAEIAMIELVDFNEVYGKTETAVEAGKRTRRGRTKKSATPKAEAEKTNDIVEPTTSEVVPAVVEETQPPVKGEADIQKGTEE
ncbi:MAG: 50S ribosomal protein L17, partial [Parafilimonas sp.]